MIEKLNLWIICFVRDTRDIEWISRKSEIPSDLDYSMDYVLFSTKRNSEIEDDLDFLMGMIIFSCCWNPLHTCFQFFSKLKRYRTRQNDFDYHELIATNISGWSVTRYGQLRSTDFDDFETRKINMTFIRSDVIEEISSKFQMTHVWRSILLCSITIVFSWTESERCSFF